MSGHRHRLRRGAAVRRRSLLSAGAGLALLLGLLLYLPLPHADGNRPAPPPDPCAANAELAPPCGAWWGAYVPTGPDGLVTSVDTLEQRTGRKLDLIYTYHDMGTGTDGELLDPAEQQLGKDHLLMLSWESDVWSDNATGGTVPLGWAKIATGDYDATVIDPQAERVKAYGRTVLIAFDQEMDSRTPADGTPAQFVAAYRHVVDQFRTLGVTNVRWVWTITGYMANTKLFSEMYPGDAYVDWIAYDQYNYYGCKGDPDWLSFAQTELPTYDWLRAHISATKPLMLAEFSTAVDQADPALQQQWYQQVPQVLKEQLPGIRAVVQWDSSVPGPDCDLSLDTAPALTGFTEAGHDPYVEQKLPW